MHSDFGDVQFDETQVSTTSPCGSVLHRLMEPVHLHVGRDRDGNIGIIGRRVTMYRVPPSAPYRTHAIPVSEGIVGFNSLPRRDASL
ncbi:hypothetical protein SPBR_03377 [Sporothrix brasiliensis 5110]|uniref:Uncharacterized protein n=1 Tax=Sporothrix brasiliensis 5110 TaxID=1398154 RepID=A0A0C2J4L8_9PEZI|nr:uncharacterized protein SPBR_03377 [Sporothrix brasiliensis 5110]KIH92012.1 hypothetical protein SPBR_03377 [Sporothrix brasiliensis 5110]